MTPVSELRRVNPRTPVSGLAQMYQESQRHGFALLDKHEELFVIVALSDLEWARERQRKRFGECGNPSLQMNEDMGPAEVRQFCGLDEGSRTLFRAAMQQMNLSAWAYHLILKLARTIVDLADSDRIETPHQAEAIQVST